MTSIIQVAECNYRTIDSNNLETSGNLGVIDEYVPPTNPDELNYKSGRRSVVINLNTLKSIEVDSKSTINAASDDTIANILKNIIEE